MFPLARELRFRNRNAKLKNQASVVLALPEKGAINDRPAVGGQPIGARTIGVTDRKGTLSIYQLPDIDVEPEG